MGNLLFLLFYYFLMFVFDVGVIDGIKDGQVLFEFVYFVFDGVGYTAGFCLVIELFGQFVYGFLYVFYFVFYFFRVQVLEWFYNK